MVYHLRSCEASILSRSRFPFAFTPLFRLTNVGFSMFSQRQFHRSSTLFKAMQLTVITLRSWEYSSPARMELTSAVFPVPGVPEMKRDDLHGASEAVVSWADATNFVITSRSADLPAIVKVPLHVDLSKARTRACMGRRATGGIESGSVEERSQRVNKRVFDRVGAFPRPNTPANFLYILTPE